MEILLLTVGKTTQPFIKQGIEEYLKRLRHYVAYKIESIPDIKNPRAQSEENLKQKEGEAILSYISASDLCILLDERGKEMTSVEFFFICSKIDVVWQKKSRLRSRRTLWFLQRCL